MRQLPTYVYRGREYFVDFRLGEMRDKETAMPLRFVDMEDDPDSEVKKELRGLRARTSNCDYIRGLDD